LRYPGATIIILATVLGAAGAMSQKFSLGEGVSAGFAVLVFTAAFILLPFWVLAFVVRRIYKRVGVDYAQGRLWFWAIPAALAIVMAIYFGVIGEQSQQTANSSDAISGVVIFFFYIYLSAIGLVVAFISSMFRLWLLKLKQEEKKK
jgi:hypothetical protein